MQFFSWLMFTESFIMNDSMMAIIKLPLWIGKFSMPAGLAVMTARYVVKLLKLLAHKQEAVQLLQPVT